jgi:hypothetical protein
MRTWRGLVGLGLLLAPAAAMAFEGTLTLRTVVADRANLDKLNGGKAPNATEVLAMTPQQLLDSKDVGAQMRESKVYVADKKVRMETPLEKNKDGYAIIDTEKNITWFVVPSEKRYIEWSEADAKAMGDKMAQMEKMLKERMATLPPDQKAQVEAMLKKLKGGPEGEGAPSQVDIKPTGATQTVNGMRVAGYEVKSGEETLVGWVTQDQPELATMLRTVQQRMEKMTPPAMRGRQSARTAIGDKGFPVRVQTLDTDHYRVEEVVTVEKKAVPADLFVLPADFTKTSAREAMRNIPDK